MPSTELILDTEDGVRRAGNLLAAGKLVAFPTETVYGLGAEAGNDHAVARIFAAKGRPEFNPLIVHVASQDAAERIAVFDRTAKRLADVFWPGPLTLVLPLKQDAKVSALVTAGLDTVALRVPGHDLALNLLAAAGCPVAAPSANPSGKTSPTLAAHVLKGLEGRIDAILDGGACDVGVESTIVTTTPDPQLLRSGGVTLEDLQAALGAQLTFGSATGHITAPGQLASHYAPDALIRLNADRAEPDEVLLGFGDVLADINLSPTGDLSEAAANLFQALRALDERGATRIAVSPIPETGLGLAINDRLSRAAAKRP
jgi:L-threonylcarbamoyladenylate synthase